MTRWPPMQATGSPPDWATGWGEDEHGAFVELTVGDATQRLRWIPPGTFTMGSSAGEAGRYSDEGPQHEVTLTRGFWLGDTPVTQALWLAVMGENPSRFKDVDRPVEQVSWDEAVAFMAALGPHLAGDLPRLPTEAEWERACRAGTDAAIWTGEWALLGESNAPALHPLAWYGGNSGESFDRDDGVDSSGWREKQLAHTRAGTRKVGLKAANPWGLYDMLGNVWEWCGDPGPRTYTAAAQVDPVGTAASSRVSRGGAWYSSARRVRAASRYWFVPGYRDVALGLRLAVQPAEPPGAAGSGQPAGGGPRPAGGRAGAERRGSR
ncbi:MAG: formylglycine-generating enzyme family protein [Myxococcales bacterium]|nr:formylglycine-generating enzyme family protein [Myxococcales bacterium]